MINSEQLAGDDEDFEGGKPHQQMSDLRDPQNFDEEEHEELAKATEERVPLLFVDVNLGGIDG